MSFNFYTNVQCIGNYILYRGIQDGVRVKHKVEYNPSMFVPSREQTSFTNIHGEFLEEIKMGSIREARDFIKKYKEVENFKIFGNSKFEYSFIAEHHPGEINWDHQYIKIATIDIEVGSENGFPHPATASEPITAITIKYMGKDPIVFGCGEYTTTKKELYIKCVDEYNLCKQFLEYWIKNYPDIITGWNIKFFDFPYLVNRFRKILGEDITKLLSPWKYINERTTVLMNKEQTVYELVGISMLDYLELYRKYSPNGSQESYKLDHIASVELKKKKLSYDEYDSLHDLYKNNFQKFIEYNIVDVELVEQLDDKLKLIDLSLTLAYDSKTNYEDVFTQVRMWDILIFNHLGKNNIIVPPIEHSEKNEAYEGAYVKDPQVGKHDWVASFDLNSLYPHLIMQFNISPDTIVYPENYSNNMRTLISQNINVSTLLNKSIDTSVIANEKVTLTPNGQFFRTDIQGFLPKMMETMYEDRKAYKKNALQAKQELQTEVDESKKFEIEKRIARYNNLQLAKKVCLNSAYGALGSQYFRFYDLRQALAITTSGQLAIRWIENKLNAFMNKLLSTDDDYVIASDTDSIYLKLGPLVNKVYGSTLNSEKIIDFMDKVCETKIQPYIDQSYQELADYLYAYAQKMQMKREALANKGIWTAKKRYILNVYNNEGVKYSTPDMKVMGLEMVKSSTPSAIREKMKEAIRIMMNNTEEELQTFISDFRALFHTLPPEEISFPRGINGLEKYKNQKTLYAKGTPIHVRGALLYNHHLQINGLTKKYPLIQEGEKIKFTYLKEPNVIHESVISYPVRLPPELGLHKYIDYDTQFDKAFLEPIKVIMDCIGWSVEKTTTLWD